MRDSLITDTASGEQYQATARFGALTLVHSELEPHLSIEVDDVGELVELLVVVAAAVEEATRRNLARPAVTRALLIPENTGTRIADARRLLEVAAGSVART